MLDKKQLHEIIQDLIEVAGEKGLKVSHDTILSESCSYQRGFIAQSKYSKPLSEKEVVLSKGPTDKLGKDKPSSELATEKQLNYIYRNNLNVDTRNLTKQEAHVIISEDKRRKQ